jgi:hypothetical protein
MILRRKGTTDKQFIILLSFEINKLEKQLYDLQKKYDDMCLEKHLISLTDFLKTREENIALIDKLKSYNLWTGK